MILNYHFNGFEDIFLLIDNVNIFENYIGKNLKIVIITTINIILDNTKLDNSIKVLPKNSKDNSFINMN